MPEWDPYTEADPCQIEFVDELYVKHDPVDPKTELLIKANL